MSFFNNRHGWSCDNVIAFELILPNSTIVRISSTSHPDLFFALRGGGNNFGIVTHFTLDTFPQGPVWDLGEVFPIEDAAIIFSELEDEARTPDLDCMVLVVVNWIGVVGQFKITRKSVYTSPQKSSHYSPRSVMGSRQFVKEGWANISDVSKEMDEMNPSGFYQVYASFTVKNSAAMNLRVMKTFMEEVENIKNASGTLISLVFNPLTKETIRLMERRGGNGFGILEIDGPLTSTYKPNSSYTENKPS